MVKGLKVRLVLDGLKVQDGSGFGGETGFGWSKERNGSGLEGCTGEGWFRV